MLGVLTKLAEEKKKEDAGDDDDGAHSSDRGRGRRTCRPG